jgi:hypothetical protein
MNLEPTKRPKASLLVARDVVHTVLGDQEVLRGREAVILLLQTGGERTWDFRSESPQQNTTPIPTQ